MGVCTVDAAFSVAKPAVITWNQELGGSLQIRQFECTPDLSAGEQGQHPTSPLLSLIRSIGHPTIVPRRCELYLAPPSPSHCSLHCTPLHHLDNMTRKQRSQAGRNITYDLSNPRNIAAFEALLEDEDQEQDSVNTKPNSKANKQQQQPGQKKKREKEKFFTLRPDAVADDGSTPATAQEAQQQQPASQQEQIQQLLEMFEGAADRSLVSDIYHASGCNMEAAADALFGLLGGAAAGGNIEPAGKLCNGHTQPAGGGI